jgi:hypothetical protein
MPDFTYSGDDSRYYPSLALSVEPGDKVTLDSDPGDGRFTLAGSAPVPDPTPDPDPAPVEPDPAPTDTPEVGN